MWGYVSMETTTSLTLDSVMTSQMDTDNIVNNPTPAALQCPPGHCRVPMTTMTPFPIQETNTSSMDCQYQVDKRLVAPVGMAIFGVLGNVLALVVLYNTKTERRRSTFYTLVAGLALTDLLGQLLTSPLPIAAYGKGLNFDKEKHLCRFHGFLMVSFGLVTPLIVCLMALERIGALCCTYFCSRFLSKSRVRTALVGTWVFAMFFASLPLLRFGDYEPQYPCSWCFLKFHFQSTDDLRISERDVESSTSTTTRGALNRSSAYAFLYALINLIIIIITVISNIVVIIVLLQARKRRRLLTRRPGTITHNYQEQPSPEMLGKRSNKGGATGKAVVAPVVPPRGRRDSQRVVQDLELQMVWLLCGMTLVFTCCWTPFTYQIIANVTSGVDTKPSQADMFLVRAAAMNQILDPWVYILLRRSLFRKIKSALICKFWCRDPAGCGAVSTTTGRGRVLSLGLQRRVEGGEEREEMRNELLSADKIEERSPGIVLNVVHTPVIQQHQQQQQQQQQRQHELHPSSLHSVSEGRSSRHKASLLVKTPSPSSSSPPHEPTPSYDHHGNSSNNYHGNCCRDIDDKTNNNHHGNVYTDHQGDVSVDTSERQFLVTANEEGDLTAANQELALISANEEEVPITANQEAVKGHEDDLTVACNCRGDQIEGSNVPEGANRGSVSGPEMCTSQTSTYVTAESCIIHVLDKEHSLCNER